MRVSRGPPRTMLVRAPVTTKSDHRPTRERNQTQGPSGLWRGRKRRFKRLPKQWAQQPAAMGIQVMLVHVGPFAIND